MAMTSYFPKGTLKGLSASLILFVFGLIISFPQKTLGKDLGTGIVVAGTSVAMMLALGGLFLVASWAKGNRCSGKGLLYTALPLSLTGAFILSGNGMYHLNFGGYIFAIAYLLVMFSCLKGAKFL